ncbi:glycosyltransferase [Methanolobus sp. WCC1]|uniref:glycosyltransferase n=1 Tax=unclassified Methanolobus TaxID=2629569 RepID=UPI0032514F86
MVSNSYFIVTPCKNEISNLPKLIDSIVSQSIVPKLWIVYDDGSTDGSSEILADFEQQYSWIKILKGEESRRDLSFHYARIVNMALNKAMDICDECETSCQYASLIDADMVLEKQFFEKLISRFEDNKNLGVASGSVVYDFDDLSTLEKGRNDLPIGGLRMWRIECLRQSKGFPISYSADAVSNVLATLNGWDTRKYDDILGLQTRRTSSAEGMWKGYRVKGESDYFRDYHPFYVFFKFVKYSFSYPFYIGLAYMDGYLSSVIHHKAKLDIPEVRHYYRNKHKEVINYYLIK